MTEDKLKAAIVETLAYSEIFEYPLSTSEIQRYLTSYKASQEEVETALGEMKDLARNNGHYALPNKKVNFGIRKERSEASRKMWQKARLWNWLVVHTPFVRMVAVTGTLAVDNIEETADVDYLVVTEPGMLWITRALILGLDRMARWFGVTLCPNYLVTTDTLLFEDRNLFTARELTQMVPLSGLGIYLHMRQENDWVNEWLPNAEGAPKPHIKPVRFQKWLQALLELPFRNALGDKLEHWEMRRKVVKLGRQNTGNVEARFSADYCKGHFDGHGKRTQNAYKRNLEVLKDSAE